MSKRGHGNFDKTEQRVWLCGWWEWEDFRLHSFTQDPAVWQKRQWVLPFIWMGIVLSGCRGGQHSTGGADSEKKRQQSCGERLKQNFRETQPDVMLRWPLHSCAQPSTKSLDPVWMQPYKVNVLCLFVLWFVSHPQSCDLSLFKLISIDLFAFYMLVYCNVFDGCLKKILFTSQSTKYWTSYIWFHWLCPLGPSCLSHPYARMM